MGSLTYPLDFPSHPFNRVDPSTPAQFHPSTDPDTILEHHAVEVLRAVRREKLTDLLNPATVKTISDLTCLPTWNVRRALERLEIVPASLPPDPKAARRLRVTALERVSQLLSDGSRLSTQEIATSLDLSYGHVAEVFRDHPARFVKYELFDSSRALGVSWTKWELRVAYRKLSGHS